MRSEKQATLEMGDGLEGLVPGIDHPVAWLVVS